MKSVSMNISNDEKMVVEAIRSRKFQNLTIQINNGKIVLVRREETLKPDLMNSREQSCSGESS